MLLLWVTCCGILILIVSFFLEDEAKFKRGWVWQDGLYIFEAPGSSLRIIGSSVDMFGI